MSAKFCLVLLACYLALVSAQPLQWDEVAGNDDAFATDIGELVQGVAGKNGPVIIIVHRQRRSPEGGSVKVEYRDDQNGRHGEVQYNHNLYTSNDGNGKIDAYAQGQRDYDHNRNNFAGGIQGEWRFKG